MAAESNAAFHHYQQQQQQSSEMISMGNYYRNPGGSLNSSVNNCATGAVGGSMIFSSNYFCGSAVLLDSVPGLKHNTGFAVEWSIDDQYIMDEGLVNYANEPAIMRYIKIAASLHDKTVRDVALRWRWMARKRRKQEDQSLGMKVKDQKEILVESSLKNNMSTASSTSMAAFSLTSNHHGHCMFSGALNSTVRHLLEENHQAFGQISINLSALKLQDNIDLFLHTRNNIITLLNDMRNMPGVMSRMPPLPVILNEELASSIFPCSPQPMMFGLSSTIPLKQEPGC